MRRLAVWLLGLAACAFAASACGRSGLHGSDAGFGLADATIDAHAGRDDAVIDASPWDAPPDGPQASGLVSVFVTTSAGLPDPTAVAIFTNPTGDVVQAGTVGSDGTAQAVVTEGGLVTVLQQGPQMGTNNIEEQLETIRGVKPGDMLVVGGTNVPTTQTGATTSMAVNYTLPASGTTFGNITTECGGGTSNGFVNSGSASITFYASCVASTFDMYAVAGGSGVNDFIWQPGNTYVNGGTLTLSTNWQPLATATLQVSHPVASTATSRTMWMGYTPLTVGGIAGGGGFTFDYAPGAGSSTSFAAWGSNSSYVTSQPGSVGSATIDMSSLPLPKFTSIATETNNTVTWTQTDAGARTLAMSSGRPTGRTAWRAG